MSTGERGSGHRREDKETLEKYWAALKRLLPLALEESARSDASIAETKSDPKCR